MAVERSSEIKICPYWRKVQFSGNFVLGLCGNERPRPKRRSTRDELPRLKECWYYRSDDWAAAYNGPAIVECEYLQTGEDYSIQNHTYQAIANRRGGVGIQDMEEIWPQEVEKFKECHSQP